MFPLDPKSDHPHSRAPEMVSGPRNPRLSRFCNALLPGLFRTALVHLLPPAKLEPTARHNQGEHAFDPGSLLFISDTLNAGELWAGSEIAVQT